MSRRSKKASGERLREQGIKVRKTASGLSFGNHGGPVVNLTNRLAHPKVKTAFVVTWEKPARVPKLGNPACARRHLRLSAAGEHTAGATLR
jgi:hypothetical protein